MTPSRRALERLTLADMAVDNRIYVVRCYLCRKTEHYLAVDLAMVMGPTRSALDIFNSCPHCGKSEYLRVSTRLPSFEDKGRLRLRRPVSSRLVWTWADVVFEPTPESPMSDFWAGRGPPGSS